jgi:hypothetical protein
MASLFQSALEYVRRYSWPVFPCVPRMKRPLTAHGFKDATTNEDQIREWWKQSPSANIAVPTGLVSGVIVMDADWDKTAGLDGITTLLSLLRDNLLPRTPWQWTPRGGIHLFFSAAGRSIRSCPAASYHKDIDLKAEGGYVLLAPSVLQSRAGYRWDIKKHIVSTPIAEFPDAMIPDDWCQPAEDGPDTATKASMDDAAVDIGDIVVRARKYLQSVEPAVQGHSGHSKLLWAASVLVHGFKLPPAKVYDILAEDYNPRCAPPWNLHDRTEWKDFCRKILEAEKLSPQRQPGWLL